MKVFISWSGKKSQKIGEVFRDWLPSVLQSAKPYFTPDDIDKGTRWSNEISEELSESEIGIICLTIENIDSDWILFEAGALSKSLDDSYVCPILFGISNTDLTGPLQQFQATTFEKTDMLKLIKIINNKLGKNKLEDKVVENVFDMWWPKLKESISEIMLEFDKHDDKNNFPVRSDRELLEEILNLSRELRNVSLHGLSASTMNRKLIEPIAIEDLFEGYISLYRTHHSGNPTYQETLDMLKDMRRPLKYIASQYQDTTNHLADLIKEFNSLTYQKLDLDNIEYS